MIQLPCLSIIIFNFNHILTFPKNIQSKIQSKKTPFIKSPKKSLQYTPHRPYYNKQLPYLMQIQVQSPQQFSLDNQCKICYLQLDQSQHYPMLICTSQHIICHSCFIIIKKYKRWIQCPFCKRNTDVENVCKFRYGIVWWGKWKELRGKYFEVLDCLVGEGKGKEKKGLYGQEYQFLLGKQREEIQKLKMRIKESQNKNLLLAQKIQTQIQKYHQFQLQINLCKQNQLIIRNQLTMLEYQNNQLKNQNQNLIDDYQAMENALEIQRKKVQEFLYKIQELTQVNLQLCQERFVKLLEIQLDQIRLRKQRQIIGGKQFKGRKPSGMINKEKVRRNQQAIDQEEEGEGSQEDEEYKKKQKNKYQFSMRNTIKIIKKRGKNRG